MNQEGRTCYKFTHQIFLHLEVVHCISNPCSNGADCIEVAQTAVKPEGGYKCGCKGGFVGNSCEGSYKICLLEA